MARQIDESGMKPGDRYNSEAEALKLHGVSRGTLREAIRFLQFQGVVRIKPGPGGGTFVDKPTWEQLASTLALVLQFSHATIESLLAARVGIEPIIAEMAASNATDAEIDAMGVAAKEMEANLGDYQPFYRAYMRFWNVIARASHNALLEMLSPALRRLTRSAGVIPNETERARALENCKAVFVAVQGRDPKKARAAMQELEDRFIENMRANYPREMSRNVMFAEFDPELDI